MRVSARAVALVGALAVVVEGGAGCSRRLPLPATQSQTLPEAQRDAPAERPAGPASAWTILWPADPPCSFVKSAYLYGTERGGGEWRGRLAWTGGAKPLVVTLPSWPENLGSVAALSGNRRVAVEGPPFEWIGFELRCGDGVGQMTWHCEKECEPSVAWRVSWSLPVGGAFLSLAPSFLDATFIDAASPPPVPAERVGRALLAEGAALLDTACVAGRCGAPPLAAAALMKASLATPIWQLKDQDKREIRWQVGAAEVLVGCEGRGEGGGCRAALFQAEKLVAQYSPQRGHCGKWDRRPRCEWPSQVVERFEPNLVTVWRVLAIHPEWGEPKEPPFPPTAVKLEGAALRFDR
jgi:hypothetical protein